MNFVMGGGAQVGIVVAQAHGAAAVPWYLAGGAPMPVAVYQPKGADSLSASYVNLANPGTYDAAPGVAPTFDAATGWTGNGTTQYLITGIVPQTTWSVLVRFSDAAINNRYPFGSYKTTGTIIFAAYPRNNSNFRTYWNGTSSRQVGVSVTSGVIGIAGNTGYYNGSADATITNLANTGVSMFLLALSQDGSPILFFAGKIQAVAIWDTSTDAATWIPAVSAAVALI